MGAKEYNKTINLYIYIFIGGFEVSKERYVQELDLDDLMVYIQDGIDRFFIQDSLVEPLSDEEVKQIYEISSEYAKSIGEDEASLEGIRNYMMERDVREDYCLLVDKTITYFDFILADIKYGILVGEGSCF